MKHQTHSMKALGFFLPPIIIAVLASLTIFGAMIFSLPEKYIQY